ncbi:hypothetical protein [Pseudomonas kilonensis]
MGTSKKDREQEILSRVFEEGKSLKIADSERPDFILEYSDSVYGDTKVGVEITELYVDETAARLMNMPNYAKRVMDGEYVHKEDKEKLVPKDIIYFGKAYDFKPFKTKLLPNPNYAIADFRKSLLESLRDKKERYKKYRADLPQHCLVIYDSFGFMKKHKREQFTNDILSTEILQELRKSPFSEIYFVSGFEGVCEEFFVQLKICDLMMLGFHLKEFLLIPKNLKKMQALGMNEGEVYAEILLRSGLNNVGTSEFRGLPTIIHGRYELGMHNGYCPVVSDNFPFLKAPSSLLSLNQGRSYFSKKSFAIFEKFTSSSYFSGDHGFRALKPKVKNS